MHRQHVTNLSPAHVERSRLGIAVQGFGDPVLIHPT
jgi:hypothetical protein